MQPSFKFYFALRTYNTLCTFCQEIYIWIYLCTGSFILMPIIRKQMFANGEMFCRPTRFACSALPHEENSLISSRSRESFCPDQTGQKHFTFGHNCGALTIAFIAYIQGDPMIRKLLNSLLLDIMIST